MCSKGCTKAAGDPFELAGVSVSTHDEEGLIAYEYAYV